jgi:NAD-dependent deacetylase
MKNVEITENSRLVVLTGAGVSAESGIPTFRAADGLWENHRVEDVASPDGFRRNPEIVQRFYNERRAFAADCQPNPGHLALAKLQKFLGDRCFLITQNVDDLHERGGSTQVLHMHGELNQARCCHNPKHVIPWTGPILEDSRCPKCESRLRPHIVWFGEIPMGMDEIEQQLQRCTHFLSIGTSGQVYPAAGFKSIARHYGAQILHFNLVAEPESDWDMQFIGPTGETLVQFVDGLLS